MKSNLTVQTVGSTPISSHSVVINRILDFQCTFSLFAVGLYFFQRANPSTYAYLSSNTLLSQCLVVTVTASSLAALVTSGYKYSKLHPALYARFLCSRAHSAKRARDDRVSCIQHPAITFES